MRYDVVVACEYSGAVRDAFIRRGVRAISADLLPAEKPGPHHQGDCFDLIKQARPKLVIAHPPCTALCVSGARWWPAKRASGEQQRAEEFFLRFTRLDCLWAIENPIGRMSRIFRKPDQIVQPWQFGHPEAKSTCLWLRGLPPLAPTDILVRPASGRWANQTASGQNRLSPGPNRWRERSRTYLGIAEAIAEQWSPLL